MEEDQEDDLEVHPDPEVLDNLIQDEILYSVNTSLDEDFNYLLAFIPTLFKTLEDSKEKIICEDWLDRLLGVPSHLAAEKRERNIYLLNLLVNIGKGELRDPFNKPPPVKLKPGMQLFGGNIQAEVCHRNMDIEVEDFAEYSRDSRTFFATKALPNGNGAFGYLAVSMGSGDATWLDCRGNSVDPKTLRKKKSCDLESKETVEVYKNLKNVMSKRSPQKERSELLPYYYGIMQRIGEITSTVETDCEIYDPVIEKMIEELQMDIINEGKVDVSEMSSINKKNWLCALKNKIEKLMEAAECRELTLNHLEKMLVEHEKNETTFLDVSNAIKPPKLDPILAEAVRDKPSEYNIAMLKRTYPAEMVNIFINLLENEKMYIVNRERTAYEEFVMYLRTEVLNEARHGIKKYNKARTELQRITKVLRKAEEIKTRLLKEVERVTVTEDTNQLEKEHMINNEIDDAKVRLEESHTQSDKIEGKIARLHDQIHQLTSEYHKMEEEGKRELDYQLKEISDLQAQVAAQERKLLMLKHKLQDIEKSTSEGCKKQREP